MAAGRTRAAARSQAAGRTRVAGRSRRRNWRTEWVRHRPADRCGADSRTASARCRSNTGRLGVRRDRRYAPRGSMLTESPAAQPVAKVPVSEARHPERGPISKVFSSGAYPPAARYPRPFTIAGVNFPAKSRRSSKNSCVVPIGRPQHGPPQQPPIRPLPPREWRTAISKGPGRACAVRRRPDDSELPSAGFRKRCNGTPAGGVQLLDIAGTGIGHSRPHTKGYR